MDWGFFTKRALGIDIGVSSIKVVEVSVVGKKKKLENYMEFRFPEGENAFKAFNPDTLLLASDKVAGVLQALFEKTNIKEKKVALAIPDFSTFFTTFTLPPMTEAEIPQAIHFEARHQIPLPLSDITFDWKIIGQKETLPGKRLRVLLVAVPNKVLESYQRMATLCHLEIKGMEAEVFGLLRALVGKEKQEKNICLVDFGWQSTTVSIVEKGNLATSHSFDISGISLTEALSKDLNVTSEKAEEMKKESGLNPENKKVFAVLSQPIASLAGEIEKICRDFASQEQGEIDEVLLSGGTASLFGLAEFLKGRLKKEVYQAYPFDDVAYPEHLAERLKSIGPSFAVAWGVGLMGTE